MNGKMQGIIVCGVLAVCLGGTLVFLNVTDNTADTSSSVTDTSSTVEDSSDTDAIQLVDYTASDVAKVEIKNQYDEFSMYKPESGKVNWAIDELSGVNISTSMEAGLADCAATLQATSVVEENVTDMTKYGLAEPIAEFTVTMSDGTSYSFCVGNTLASSERYRYLCEKDGTTVYQVLNSVVTYMIEAKETYVNTSLVVEPDTDSYPDYGKLTVSRTDLDYNIVVINDDETDENSGAVSAQIMTSPVYGYLNITNSTATTHGIWGLSAESCVMIHPTDEDMATYGLDNPNTTVTLVGDSYDYKLTIGNAIHAKDDDGNDMDEIASYYCYFEGVDGTDCIWQISASDLPWATVLPQDIITSMMTYNYVVNLSDIVIDYNGEKTTFESSADEDKANVISASINGEDMDVDIFKGFYQYLLTCPTSEIYFTDPTTECFLSIDINTDDGGGDKLEFFKDTDRRTIVKLNGVTSYRIETTWVDQFVKNIDLVAAGEEAKDTY